MAFHLCCTDKFFYKNLSLVIKKPFNQEAIFVMKTWLFSFLFFFVHCAQAEFQVDIITDKLRQPWGITQLPDERFLVSEKRGNLRIVDNEGNISAPLSGLPEIKVIGQGGLMDVALHPDFKDNRWIYLSFTAGNSVVGYGTEVVRAVLENNQLSEVKQIFTALPKVKGGRHFGSRLLVDENKYLFISLGDRGRRHEAQNLKTHLGSLIRLHDDGRVPEDNPFVDVKGAKGEIYSYGHRNVQGLTKDFDTNVIWAHEHGPQGGDEINRIEKGKNYGWPIITFGAEYGTGFKIGEGTEKAGMEQPAFYWDPSIAPSGLAVLDKQLWVGALKFQLLVALTINNNQLEEQKRYFQNQFGRIRDVKAFGDALYLIVDSKNGKLIRLKKK
jgi:glucose/arabinose dehydrogenase